MSSFSSSWDVREVAPRCDRDLRDKPSTSQPGAPATDNQHYRGPLLFSIAAEMISFDKFWAPMCRASSARSVPAICNTSRCGLMHDKPVGRIGSVVLAEGSIGGKARRLKIALDAPRAGHRIGKPFEFPAQPSGAREPLTSQEIAAVASTASTRWVGRMPELYKSIQYI